MCHSSFRGVVELLRDLFDTSLSVGAVHNVVRQAVSSAREINARQDLSGVQVGAHDEIFQGGAPVLVGADVRSTYCYLLSQEEHRDADTWGVRLLELAAQGLKPQATVADGGLGLRAGQALAWPDVPCRGDVFHAERDAGKAAIYLENRALGTISYRDTLEQKMVRAKRRGRGNEVSKKLALARQEEARAVALADDIETLAGWLQREVLALAGPDHPTRCALFDFIAEERSARAVAEDARQRSQLLAEASILLSSSTDHERTLTDFAGLAIPRYADWCTVGLVGTGRCVERLTAVHVEPAKVELVKELWRRHSLEEPDAPTCVLRTRKALLLNEIPDSFLVDSRDPGNRSLLESLGPTSAIIVPMEIRGELLGSFSLVSTRPGHRYSQLDVAMAEDLGRRAALAIDHGRLFDEAQAAVREAGEALRARDEFLFVASHEMRTPLTALTVTMNFGYRRAMLKRRFPAAALAAVFVAGGLALAPRAVAQTSSAVRSALVIVVENNEQVAKGGGDPWLGALDRVGEPFYADLLVRAAGRHWDRVVALSDSSATFENFASTLRALDREGYAIDVILDIHGSSSHSTLENDTNPGPDRLCFAGGSATPEAIAALGRPRKLRLNAVYMVACWGSRFNQAWRKAGARAANGAREINYYVLLSPLVFVHAFGAGADLETAAERAFEAEARVLDRPAVDRALARHYGERGATRIHGALSSGRIQSGPAVRAACYARTERAARRARLF